MVLRIRHPHTPPADRDLGPGAGRLHDFDAMRKTIEDALRQPKARIGHTHAAGVEVEVTYR